ncbi:hypothetical protein Tco_0871706 [Tanacetum coccineum]
MVGPYNNPDRFFLNIKSAEDPRLMHEAMPLLPSFQASTSGVNERRHYTRRNASASTSRTSTNTTLYDESEEDSVDEDDMVHLGNDVEIRNENLDDYFE